MDGIDEMGYIYLLLFSFASKFVVIRDYYYYFSNSFSLNL